MDRRARALTWLNIGENDFMQIPGWLGDLTWLTRLDLGSSRLGHVPEWLTGSPGSENSACMAIG